MAQGSSPATSHHKEPPILFPVTSEAVWMIHIQWLSVSTPVVNSHLKKKKNETKDSLNKVKDRFDCSVSDLHRHRDNRLATIIVYLNYDIWRMNALAKRYNNLPWDAFWADESAAQNGNPRVKFKTRITPDDFVFATPEVKARARPSAGPEFSLYRLLTSAN